MEISLRDFAKEIRKKRPLVFRPIFFNARRKIMRDVVRCKVFEPCDVELTLSFLLSSYIPHLLKDEGIKVKYFKPKITKDNKEVDALITNFGLNKHYHEILDCSLEYIEVMMMRACMEHVERLKCYFKGESIHISRIILELEDRLTMKGKIIIFTK